jgi:hypothetical protein
MNLKTDDANWMATPPAIRLNVSKYLQNVYMYVSMYIYIYVHVYMYYIYDS